VFGLYGILILGVSTTSFGFLLGVLLWDWCAKEGGIQIKCSFSRGRVSHQVCTIVFSSYGNRLEF
jgi:hypothetical protein